MKTEKKKNHIGSSFDEMLKEDGILEHSTAVAIKRVLTWQLEHAMKKRHLSKSALGRLMHTSRPAVDRLFDPDNASITLKTLASVANALGKEIKLELH
jgi:antitoxin HicB